MKNKQILIVEDDPAILLGLKELLLSENYSVSSQSDGLRGLKEAINKKPDLVLLDINLPTINGMEICRRLRENRFFNPIIILTSRDEYVDKIIGLEIGANDYITKPFNTRELLARIKANLRDYNKEETIINDEIEYIKDRKLLAIMFTDIKDYSKKMHLNEEKAIHLLQIHNKILKQKITDFTGNIIEIIGDAFLVSFESATAAVSCAIEIQKEFEAFNKNQSENKKFQIRIGIHIGDVIEFEGKLKGDTLNIAARIQQNAVAGSVFISGEVQSILKTNLKIRAKDIGMFTLKNISEPLQIYKIDIHN